MKLIETQRVKVGDLEFPVKLTYRAMIDYEALSGGSISTLSSSSNIAQLFYCTAKAGAKALGEVFKYTYEEFLDIIDEHFVDVITNFGKVLSVESGGDGKKHKGNQ